MTKRTINILRALGTVIATPVVIVCAVIALAYLPPVQKWLVNTVGERMEESLGMRVHVEEVCITPFLDLVAGGVTAIDTEGDTIFGTERLTFDVAFRPLLAGRADIEGFLLKETSVNTKSMIPDCRIRGRVGELKGEAHGVAWTSERVRLTRAELRDADVMVVMTDTAAKDTSSHVAWVIDVDRARVFNSKVCISLPPDSTSSAMVVTANVGSADLLAGHFDLGEPSYAFRQLKVLGSSAMVARRTAAGRMEMRQDTIACVMRLGTTVDTLSYDGEGVLRCGVRNLAFQEEKYGLQVKEIGGEVYLDSVRFEVPALRLHTPYSRIDAGISMEWEALERGDFGQMRTTINAALGREDIADLLDKAVREKYVDRALLRNEYVRMFLNKDINLSAVVSGNVSHLNVESYSICVPQVLKAQGNLRIDDDFQAYGGRISASVLGGIVSGRFNTHLQRETYDVDAQITRFPISRFVDGVKVGPFTGHVRASGKGFDPMAMKSSLKGNIRAQRLTVENYDLSGLVADASLGNGIACADLRIKNRLGKVCGNIEADIRHGYDLYAHLDLDDIALHEVAGTTDSLWLHTVLDMHALLSGDMKRIEAEGGLTENFVTSPTRSVEMKDLDFALYTAPDTTTASVSAGDLTLDMGLDGNFEQISASATALTDTLMKQLETKAIDQEAIRHVLPTAFLSLHAVHDNPLHNYLRFQGTELSAIDIDLTTDSIRGVNGSANVGMLNIGSLQLDTIYATISQDSEGIKMLATVHNYQRQNTNRFKATVNAALQSKGFEATLLFKDEKGRTGIDLGMRAETENGTAHFTLFPQHPVIAYRTFTINEDNFVTYNRDGKIRADIHLVADDGTGLIVNSEPTGDTSNDITLSVYHLNLGELCDALPYMPNLEGTINGDFHIKDEHGDTQSLSAMGSVEAESFAYEGTTIGNLGAEIIYLPKENGEHYADAFISYNGEDVGECSGVYRDTDDHFNGDIVLNAFPLNIVNAFLEGTDFMMRGEANGEFSLDGTLDRPVMNGVLNFSDAHFCSPVYGVDMKMEERPLVFSDSRLNFEDYKLTSGTTDLIVNGNVDMTDLSDVRLNFAMNADRFELINTRRQAASLVYGKVLSAFNGTAKGSLDDLIVRGQLDILPGTDATYLLTNSPLTVQDRLAELVTFTNFCDSTATAPDEEKSIARYDVRLAVNISDGAKFHCFLSANGNSYVNLQGGGNLTLRMTHQDDVRMTGRYTIQEGEMNYELPIVPLKAFQLAQGSYVEFSGDIMNPRLSISATEDTKALVAQGDLQRSVDFIVGVDISRTLDDMGLAFTIDAPQDLSIQNELAAMSEEDRNKTAVALLATGMYVTENLTSGLKASSALNAFLQSEIQNIAGKALSTFDLSFGMENGTSAAGTTTTDYSFRFSKRFLDDRFRINIGGKVSTGADATNDAASFIDNISLEYRLDNSGTRYLRVFYDRDSHDPLEGNMMKTGAGLVMRRQTHKLGELFIFRRKR